MTQEQKKQIKAWADMVRSAVTALGGHATIRPEFVRDAYHSLDALENAALRKD